MIGREESGGEGEEEVGRGRVDEVVPEAGKLAESEG